jgi:uncharacterized protein with PIN domain
LNKVKITSNKQKCRYCEGKLKAVNLDKDPKNRVFRDGQKYYFTRYIKCLECGFKYNLESYKIMIKE